MNDRKLCRDCKHYSKLPYVYQPVCGHTNAAHTTGDGNFQTLYMRMSPDEFGSGADRPSRPQDLSIDRLCGPEGSLFEPRRDLKGRVLANAEFVIGLIFGCAVGWTVGWALTQAISWAVDSIFC